MNEAFATFLNNSYDTITQGIRLGRPIDAQSKLYTDHQIVVPVARLTQHGLISGGTGTGKSRAIQLMIEQLQELNVPVLLSDIKGDMSGLSSASTDPGMTTRAQNLDYEYKAEPYPVRYWGSADGLTHLRMRLCDISPVLVAQLLGLNQTQESHLGVVYRYAQTNAITLTTLDHLLQICAYLSQNPRSQAGLSSSSLDVIQRNIENLSATAIGSFFGEPSLVATDMLDAVINILWLQNYQQQNYNVGNLMSLLLYQLYIQLPEVESTDTPKLIICIDEAHQLFLNASPGLITLLTNVLKQIRSKGVGVLLSTQSAEDIPESIREQLGLKMQFALRSFGSSELQELRSISNSFPKSDFYTIQEDIKTMATGTCFVSLLDTSGALLAPVKLQVYPPASAGKAPDIATMSSLSDTAYTAKYATTVGTAPLQLGSSLNDVHIPGSSSWEMKQFVLNKQDQRVRREVRMRNKDIRRSLYIVLAIVTVVAFIVLLYLVLQIIRKS